MHKWIRPVVALVILSVSMLLLSTIFENLSPYLAIPNPQEKGPPERKVNLTEDKRLIPPDQMLVKPGRLLFVVSPADPVLYWRTSTADYYDGLGWYRTTRQITTDEFPSIQRGNATQVFTVEFNMTEKEISLPVPPPRADLTHPVLSPSVSHEYYLDEIGDTYGMRILGLSHEAMIVYQAGWHYTEIDKWRVSLDDIPQEIRDIYLQLPSLPVDVVDFAEMLKRPGMNAVDQILSDVAYFLIHFDYDLDYYMGRIKRTITRDWVLSYLQWRKGVCLDAATALAVILRYQGIPSRISLGYKPTKIAGDKILYFSNTSHAETEAYLPPYGWVRFDATPFSPLDLPEDEGSLRPEKGLTLETSQTEATGYPGESVFYHLMLNNSRDTKDHFALYMNNTNGWNDQITPESLSIGAFETRDVLIEVKIPENASYGQADIITVTATSTYDPDVTISNTTIARVGKVKRVSTITDVTYIDNSAFRGDGFYVEGTVFATDYEPVHNMSVLVLFKENKETTGMVCGSGFTQDGFFRIEGQVPFDIELGDYIVVAISLGTTEYAPSSSDPCIKVVARTYIELDISLEGARIARPFLVDDHVHISGFLRLDNGTTLPSAILELEVLAPGSPRVTRREIITEHGFFVKKFTFWTHGTYELNASFLGEGHIAGSHAYRKIDVGSPLVQGLTESYCVRGEMLNIRGNVSSNNGGIPEEPITITFDGDVLATVKTGPDGTFFYNWKMNSELQPGWHLLAYIPQKRTGIGVTQYIRVMIKAQVTINALEEVTGGDPFICSICLRDDHGFPVDGEEIFVGNYGLSSKTDKHGNVKLRLNTLPIWWGIMNLTATFEGSETYLPSSTFAIVAVQPGFASIFLVSTIAVLFILGLAVDRGKFKRLFYKGKRGGAELEDVSILAKKEVSQAKVWKTRALRINFPEIRSPFPNVWGVTENLWIECGLDGSPRKRQEKNEIELLVNGKIIAKDWLSKNRTATFSYVFNEKGEHEIGAMLVRKSQCHPMKGETKLRIVDYREEIIRLYKTFLQHLIHQDVKLRDDMTAREVEHLLTAVSDLDLKNLHKVIDRFEKAEYSNHKVSRENYETMYLSLRELITDVD